MQPNFLAAPQKFALSTDGPVNNFFEAIGKDNAQFINGSVVTSPDAPGSLAYVAASNGIQNGKPSQRLLLNLHSPKAPVMAGMLEFTSANDPEEEIFGALAGLAMSVIPALLGSNVDSKDHMGSSGMMVPIIVGPSSAIQGEMPEGSDLMMPEGVIGTLFNVAKTVIPAIAPVALDVAQQLLSKTSAQSTEEELLDWGGIVGDIVKVAAPVAGAALTELGKQV